MLMAGALQRLLLALTLSVPLVLAVVWALS
jgi:hypothetical protein